MKTVFHRLLPGLFVLYCFAYPFAVTGIAFDVRSPFTLDWAGSALLLLEGILLVVAAMLLYGELAALCAGLLVIVLSYLVEAVGVNSGFPFGVYRYTDVLLFKLPGGVPLTVMFAWILIVFGVYGWIGGKTRLSIRAALFGAALATLLDLAIEPVAAHIVHYWEWLAPGPLNYYGVPPANFIAWFIVSFGLLLLIDRVLRRTSDVAPKLAMLAPCILFGSNLLMFGLIDLTHRYIAGCLLAMLAGSMLAVYAFANNRLTDRSY